MKQCVNLIVGRRANMRLILVHVIGRNQTVLYSRGFFRAILLFIEESNFEDSKKSTFTSKLQSYLNNFNDFLSFQISLLQYR